MAEEREVSLIIVTGKKGVGKTFQTLKIIDAYIRDNERRAGRKVLIFDANGEYTQFTSIALKDVPRFAVQTKVEVRRVLPLMPNGSAMGVTEMVKAMGYILENYRGGLLVLEDINRYTAGSSGNELVSSITTNRHKSMDIIMHLQSLRRISPVMWQNVNIVRFHSQIDDVAGAKNKIPNYEIVKLAQTLVNYKYRNDPRFFCYIIMEENLIKGIFSKADFSEACRLYLSENSTVLKKAVDADGNKMNWNDAIQAITEDLMKYYGNVN